MGVVTAHAMLLQCSADLLARASMTDIKTFSGKWGCPFCLCPGSTTPTYRLHHFWPYDPVGSVRSPESFRDDGKQALVNAHQDGVHLPPPLYLCSIMNYTCRFMESKVQLLSPLLKPELVIVS